MGSFISTPQSTQDQHCPTPDDVFAVRSFLLDFVPAELANLILNEANYWPKATLSFEPENSLMVLDSPSIAIYGRVCCFVTSKLCDLICSEPYKIKTVCFKIVSHDQGWCSTNFQGPYEGSHTWFEAVIVRDFITDVVPLEPGQSYTDLETIRIHRTLERGPNPELVTVKPPDDEDSDTWNIQRNERAYKEFQLHTVVWTEEEEEAENESILMNETGRGLGRGFVRSLMKEDRIAVMARAQYPGWVNHVQSVELEIYYSV